MLVLSIRTDKPMAEIGLFENGERIGYETWEAHRQLAETIHLKIDELVTAGKKTLHDIQGLVVFKGPGSFTGLRIGLSVANTIAYGLSAPIVATEHDDWIDVGLARLAAGENETIAIPEYGAPVHITKQKK